MTVDKVFIYVTRSTSTGSELLVLASHDEFGYEVPKGSVEHGESLHSAVYRELVEETGIMSTQRPESLGTTTWKGERQHFFHLREEQAIPDRFEHCVCSQDDDNGFVYAFRWLLVEPNLEHQLVQGCDRFIKQLIQETQRS